jgi:apolipoprotein D and lipocalin family protein
MASLGCSGFFTTVGSVYMTRQNRWTYLVVGIVLFGMGCSGIPSGVTVIEDFDQNQYLGKWYEIARLDHSFERGLSRVTAEYTLRPDGRIDVLNRGYNPAKDAWQEARGIARLAGDPKIGSLKVSFFAPIWADYHIIALDKDTYQYAMVTSSSRDYLWILARTSALDEQVLNELLKKAAEWDYAVDKLIYPEHN